MTVDTFLREQMTAQLLRYAAGHHIWCKECGNVLDWQRTVILKGAVCCDKCFQHQCNEVLDNATDEQLANFEEWFAKVDLDSAHNWHIEGGRMVRGAQLLTD